MRPASLLLMCARMKPTRLFQSIVVVGASLTGAALPLGVLLTTTGCTDMSQAQSWPDIGVPGGHGGTSGPPSTPPFPWDFSTPEDLTADGGPDAK